MTPWTALARRPALPIETACGEIEYERFSRRANGAEAFVVYLLVQSALWSGIGHASDAGHVSWPQVTGLTVAAVVLGFATAVAPWLHGDRWHDLGLSAPRELRERWPEYGWASRAGVIGLSLAIPILLVWVGWETLLVRLGIRATWPAVHHVLAATPWKHLGTTGSGAALGLALAGALIRWTNLGTAARAAAWPVGLLLASIVASALLAAASSGDWTRFGQFSWVGSTGFFPRLAAYGPWALLQQWLLLSYLNTRIRKTVPRTGWLGLPGWAITPGLTGLAFGAMHAPNVPLALLTFAVGCVSGWLFQMDRSRNLSVVALAHGLAGTLLAMLTTVPMDVGPRV